MATIGQVLQGAPGAAPDDDDELDLGNLDIAYSPDNPLTGTAEENLAKDEIDDDFKQKTVAIITKYRSQWAQDRILRMPQWTKNLLYYRGQQILAWDAGNKTYFDALAYYRSEGKQTDGDDTYLERYSNNITKMCGTGYVGRMSRGVPPTIIRPENAEILADVTTAKAAQESISIIERINMIRKMVRLENTYMYLYGCYFKYTRGVLDGNFAGWDEEEEMGEKPFQKPNRYHCPGCGEDTPADQANGACQNCKSPVGSADFYPAEMSSVYGVIGTVKKPRAMVRWTVHNPFEVDCDPQAQTLADTPILAFDQEVDIGSLRMTFPDMTTEITEGQATPTTPNSSYERLRRSEVFSAGQFTSDTTQQRPTYSQVWVQPYAYWRDGDKDYATKANNNFPEGMKVSMSGEKVVSICKAVLVKEWSSCTLLEGMGLYSPAIADDVVPFNERFNDTLDFIDDYVQRCSAGVVLADGRMLDRRELTGKVMTAGVLNFVTTLVGGGEKPLSDAIHQLNFSLDQNIMQYPNLLMQYCQVISGVTPQSIGTGTTEGVETAKGQELMDGNAEDRSNPYWENLKGEHAQASQNAIECLQRMMKAGLVKEIWDVVQSNGSQFRNNYVNLDRMQGKVQIFPDIDQGLPQSPEQIRSTYSMLIKEAGNNNPVALEICDEQVNKESMMAVLGSSEMVIPGAAQRAKTLQDINTLLENPGVTIPGMVNPDGTPAMDLPIKPLRIENFKVAKETIQGWALDNCDIAKQNPAGLQRVLAFNDLLEQVEVGVAVQDAQRKAAVTKAATPQPPENKPDPTVEQAKQELLKKAVGAVDRLEAIGGMPPLGPSDSMAAQVSANKELLDSALKAQAQ